MAHRPDAVMKAKTEETIGNVILWVAGIYITFWMVIPFIQAIVKG